MHADQSRIGASFLSKQAADNPRELLVKLITDNKSASKDEVFKLFQEAIEDDPGYERAIRWYFFVNMYDYAVRPNRNPNRGAQAAAVAEQLIAKAVLAIKGQLLDLPMPNGKAMRDCTGAEMARFGNRYQRIAEKVGKAKMVGAVLSEDQVKAIMK